MFTFSSKTTSIITLLALSVCSACGSDSGSSGVSSGVDGSKPVNTLDANDGQKLCNAVASYGTSRVTPDSIRRAVCVGLTRLQPNPPTVQQCNDFVAQCLMTGNQAMGTSPVTATLTCPPGGLPTTCTATVGELQTCATALINQGADSIGSLTCDLWGLPPADAQKRFMDAVNRPALAECAPIQQKCSGVLGQVQTQPPQ
jgi:hypothetical protein